MTRDNTYDYSAINPNSPRALILEGMAQLDQEIASIDDQLRRARALKAEKGEYSDRDWYARANRALASKKAQRQRYQNWLGLQKQTRGQNFAQAFIDISRHQLPEDLFGQLMRLTQEKVDESSQ